MATLTEVIEPVNTFRDGYHHAIKMMRHWAGFEGIMSIEKILNEIENLCPKPKELS